MMTGRAFACIQPGGAFGLQILDGAIDRLVDLGRRCARNRIRFTSRNRLGEAKLQQKPGNPVCSYHHSISLDETWVIDANQDYTAYLQQAPLRIIAQTTNG